MNLQNSIRDNFIVALVAYIKICEPKQIACDLNTISKYFSEVSGGNLNEDIDYPSDKTWEDLIGKQIPDGSKWIYDEGEIDDVYGKFDSFDKCVFIDERHAKSALAMAQISQLIPYYGGAITDEEWGNSSTIKHVIVRMEGKLDCAASFVEYIFLAFHTAEQRDKFLKYNKQLVNDYLMLG